MGLLKVETWDGSKSKGRKKKKKKKKKDEVVEETGCWIKFSFGICMPSSRSKVNSSMTGTTISFDNLLLSLFFFFGKFLSSCINFKDGVVLFLGNKC
ncbi:hypothetical protein RchiOBHm_Chr4g0440211 [Rosa chinensis]|uniref:Uncharacterized protein n=1 Tax=Rosa chinensis TaxID=74649 RepID=A0A2P6R336_ROSCH|nr:hypothetical protein RchiOBHm_Chr4g0440211 [Rosa chinensis]